MKFLSSKFRYEFADVFVASIDEQVDQVLPVEDTAATRRFLPQVFFKIRALVWERLQADNFQVDTTDICIFGVELDEVVHK